MNLQYLGAFLVGIFIGFLGGLFGKGGSAIATPLLSILGFPGFIAVAAPLPATVPGTLVTSAEYWRSNLLDWQIILWSIAIGMPATIIGSLLTIFTGSTSLLIVTGLLVMGFGISFLYGNKKNATKPVQSNLTENNKPSNWRLRLFGVAAFVGVISGLLANSGGFLLAPSYAKFLGQPIKKSFACSLAVSAVLALPGTIVHAYLGHISWGVTGIIALGSIPFSYLGAKVALKTKSSRLERWYGIILTLLGIYFFLHIFQNVI